MAKDKPLSEHAQWAIQNARQEAKLHRRNEMTPYDLFRSLLEMSEGHHLRILVDELNLDLSRLREAARQWSFHGDPNENWESKILQCASMEAELAMRKYASSAHLLLALIQLWPQAPCSQLILRAAGGSINAARNRMLAHW
jgi:ATP-dependent Clp protease ATP-binding subunit ClpA